MSAPPVVRPGPVVGPVPRVGLLDLAAEAVAGVRQRPVRSALTALGAAIGVCAVVVVLGLTATASARVNERFDALRATEVTATVSDGAGVGASGVVWPTGAATRVAAIAGVVAAGTVGSVDLGTNTTVTSLPLTHARSEAPPPVRTVDAAAWRVLHPHLAVGRIYDAGHEQRADRVAVLGVGAADRLGITRLDAQPAVFVDGVALTVVGILDDVRRSPDLLGAVVVPPTTARQVWRADPAADPTAALLVETRLGAASVVAARIPWVVDPAHPAVTRVDAPPDPRALSDSVGSDLDVLALTLAAVSVLLGALGISNTMLVTVMERIHEIGLRRALGAGAGQIGTQFLVEAAVLGGLGGIAGSTVGVATVVVVAVARDWTPVLAPWVVLAAPVLGLVAGLVAGVVPAVRAARIQPADALRR